MKALSGLPPRAYLKVSEETKVPLAELLNLVQELETGVDPAYIARYRPRHSAGLDETGVRRVERRLREFLELAERRVSILTALARRNRLTPELREKIEAMLERGELEDIYLPFKPKRRGAADEAIEAGLEPQARFIWDQTPPEADLGAEAEKYVKPDSAPASVAEVLAGARAIIARWLSENAEIRRDLRRLASEEAEVVVRTLPSSGQEKDRAEAAEKKYRALDGFRTRAGRVPWRRMLTIRRGVREGRLERRIEIPERRFVEYLLARLLKDPESVFRAPLEEAAELAVREHLVPAFEDEVRREVEEGCDREAIQVFEANLRKLLLQPGAGAVTVIGLETSRPGGWRVAVVGPDGEVLEVAVIRSDETAKTRTDGASARKAAPPATSEKLLDARVEELKPEAGEASDPRAAAASKDAAPSAAQPEEQPEKDVAESAAESSPEPSEESAPAAPSAESAIADPAEPSAAETPEPPAEPTPAEPSTAQNEPAAAPIEAAADSGQASGPSKPDLQNSAAKKRIDTPRGDLTELIAKHKPALIVMGNGPGVRQIERFVRAAVRKANDPKTAWMTAPEAGSWIWATSRAARKEAPDLEPAVRSAVCLARRAQDPLAEYVKVDPRILGVGQGHQDVDQKRLRTALGETLATCLHLVGVDVNRASVEALALVPGMTLRAAKRIVDQRKKSGGFPDRKTLSKTPGLNSRIWSQAAGYLRIYDSPEPLDAGGVHPRHYDKLKAMLAAAEVSVEDALRGAEALDALQLEQFEDRDHPLALLRALLGELSPEARNPRGAFEPPKPSVEVDPIDQAKTGMKIEGVVTNVTAFGAFVDIGVEQDGLVHVSRLSGQVVEDGRVTLRSGERITVWVTAIEQNGRRISLSMREPREPQESSRRRRVSADARAAVARRDPRGRRENGDAPRRGRERASLQRSFGPDERKRAREEKQMRNLSMDEKLSLLESKFRTKV